LLASKITQARASRGGIGLLKINSDIEKLVYPAAIYVFPTSPQAHISKSEPDLGSLASALKNSKNFCPLSGSCKKIGARKM
jgi:hypothetical protein